MDDPATRSAPLDEPEEADSIAAPAPVVGTSPPATAPVAPAEPAPVEPATPHAAPVEPAPAPEAVQPRKRERGAAQRGHDRKRAHGQRTRERRVAVAPVAAPAPVAPPATQTQTTPATTVTVRMPAAAPVKSGRRFYTVRSGDHLWSIATALLGRRIDGLPEDERTAQIQARVDQLYQLNRDKIGGDPNQLVIGTVLRLW